MCQIYGPNTGLRQTCLQFVDLARAGILNKQRGTIRSATRPKPEWTEVAFEALQLENRLVMALADFSAAVGAFAADQVVEIDRFGIRSPNWIVERAGRDRLPFGPL